MIIQQEAYLRHAQYYLGVLSTAEQLFLQSEGSAQQGLSLFELDWENIRHAFDWTAKHGETNESADKLCSAFPSAGGELLQLRQDPKERLHWSTAALSAAQRVRHQQAIARNLNFLGNAYYDLAEFEMLVNIYQHALTISRGIGDSEGEAVSLGNLGNVYMAMEQYEAGINAFQQALTIARGRYERQYMVWIGNMARAYFELGQTERATEFCKQALTIARRYGDRRSESAFLNTLGGLHLQKGQPVQALKDFQESLSIAFELKDSLRQAQVLTNQARVHNILGQYEPAIESYERSLNIFQALGVNSHVEEVQNEMRSAASFAEFLRRSRLLAPIVTTFRKKVFQIFAPNFGVRQYATSPFMQELNRIQILLNQGLRALHAQNLKKAASVYQKAIHLAEKQQRVDLICIAQNQLGKIALEQGEWIKALSYFTEALAGFQRDDQKRERAGVMHNLGVTYLKIHEYDEAVKFFQNSLVLKREVGEISPIAATLYNLAVLETLRGNLGKAYHFCVEALDKFKLVGAPEAIHVETLLHNMDETFDRGKQALSNDDLQSAKNYLLQSLDFYQAADVPTNVAEVAAKLGELFQKLGQLEEADKYLSVAVEVDRSQGSEANLAASLHSLGNLRMSQSRFEDAVNLYLESLQIDQARGDCKGIAMSKLLLGHAYKQLGELEKATAISFEAHQVFEQLGEHKLARAALSLANSSPQNEPVAENHRYSELIHSLQEGLSAERRGQTKKAINLYEKILESSRASDYPEGIALSALQIGMLIRPQDPHRAVQFYEECVQATGRATVNLDEIRGNALHNMGTAYAQLARPDLAERYLKDSLTIRRRLQNRTNIATALNNLMIALIQQGKWDDAYPFGIEALEISKSLNDEYGSARALVNLGTICRRQGKRKEAIDYYERALERLARLKAPETESVRAALLALHLESNEST